MKYVSLAERASMNKEGVTEDGLIEQAARGALTLCAWVDGWCYGFDDARRSRAYPVRVRGYVAIPAEAIDPRRKTARLERVANLYEAFPVGAESESEFVAETGMQPEPLYFCSLDDAAPGGLAMTPMTVDLADCRAPVPGTGASQVAEDRGLSPKSFNFAAKIIGGLIMANYKSPIHAPKFESMGQVLDDLASVGVDASDATIRKYINVAKDLIARPKKSL